MTLLPCMCGIMRYLLSQPKSRPDIGDLRLPPLQLQSLPRISHNLQPGQRSYHALSCYPIRFATSGTTFFTLSDKPRQRDWASRARHGQVSGYAIDLPDKFCELKGFRKAKGLRDHKVDDSSRRESAAQKSRVRDCLRVRRKRHAEALHWAKREAYFRASEHDTNSQRARSSAAAKSNRLSIASGYPPVCCVISRAALRVLSGKHRRPKSSLVFLVLKAKQRVASTRKCAGDLSVGFLHCSADQ